MAAGEIATGQNLRRSWTRLDGVDLLRGLAILFVLLNHVNMRLRLAKVPYTEGLPDQFVSSLVWNGQRGVQIFFAISGFLITATSIRRWGSLGDVRVRDFYILRFARIAPLFVALLSVLIILDLIGVPNFVVPARTGGLGRALLAAIGLHVNVLEATRGYLPGNWDILWSLSVEEVFYLFFPLVCAITARIKLLVPLLFAFIIVGPFGRTVFTNGNEVWREYSYLGGMDAIAMGCLTALWLSRVQLSRKHAQWFVCVGIVVLVFTLCFTVSSFNVTLRHYGLDMTLVALGTCMLICAAVQTQWTGPMLLRPLLRMGQRSYEVYLTHMFVVFGLFQVFLIGGKRLSYVPALFGTVILVSGLLGEIVARFYSEPINRFLRKRLGDGPEKLGSVMEIGPEAAPAH